MSDWSMVQRVHFGDVDSLRHLNNVQFLRFFETARITWFGDVMPDHSPVDQREFGFIFAECHIVYRAPAYFGEDIRTWIRPSELRRMSVKLDFEMRVEGDDRLVAEGWGLLVGYDYEALKSRRLPQDVRDRLEPLLG